MKPAALEARKAKALEAVVAELQVVHRKIDLILKHFEISEEFVVLSEETADSETLNEAETQSQPVIEEAA